jgi:hypothetical protein
MAQTGRNNFLISFDQRPLAVHCKVRECFVQSAKWTLNTISTNFMLGGGKNKKNSIPVMAARCQKQENIFSSDV